MKTPIIFPMQVTKRVYRWVLILTLIPTLLLAFIIPLGTIKMIKAQRERELQVLAEQLENSLTVCYDEMLKEQGAANKTTEEKVFILHQRLQPIVDYYAKLFPKIGMGFYSRNLNSILASYPVIEPFRVTVASPDSPFLNIYFSGKSEYGQLNNSPTWQGDSVIWYVSPVFSKGEIFGHVWANVRVRTVYADIAIIAIAITAVWLLVLLLLIWVSRRLFSQMKGDLENFTSAVLEGKETQASILPELEDQCGR